MISAVDKESARRDALRQARAYIGRNYRYGESPSCLSITELQRKYAVQARVPSFGLNYNREVLAANRSEAEKAVGLKIEELLKNGEKDYTILSAVELTKTYKVKIWSCCGQQSGCSSCRCLQEFTVITEDSLHAASEAMILARHRAEVCDDSGGVGLTARTEQPERVFPARTERGDAQESVKQRYEVILEIRHNDADEEHYPAQRLMQVSASSEGEAERLAHQEAQTLLVDCYRTPGDIDTLRISAIK